MIASAQLRLVSLVAAAAAVGAMADAAPATQGATEGTVQGRSGTTTAASEFTLDASSAEPARRPQLPGGGRRVYPGHVLVAFYGTAQTASMGVLGENKPATMTKRLKRVARPYDWGDRDVQIVYELIVTIADASPGQDGDYTHFIPRRYVRKYVHAARRYEAILVLDLQPGRATFPSQARKFRWALRKPWVGLALDPEWRMGPHQVPAQTIGSVKAREVNKVSAMMTRLRKRHDLPQKVFMLHQFRSDMIRNIDRVRERPGLAIVQHVDGFGTQRQKLATYHAVARPRQFRMGFKLFYDEDVDMFRPSEVRRIRPKVQFVSYQ